MNALRLVAAGLIRVGSPTVLKVTTGFWILVIGVYMTLPYVHYIPPDFSRGFLIGKESYFYSLYAVGFYAHILSAPVVLGLGLIQSSTLVRRRYARWHRRLGVLYYRLLLGLMLPGGVIIAVRAYGGTTSVAGFLFLCLATAWVTVGGKQALARHDLRAHGQWMQRSFLLVCSAVFVRVLSVLSENWELEPIESYRWIVWLSWVPPFVIFEMAIRLRDRSVPRGVVPAGTNGPGDRAEPKAAS